MSSTNSGISLCVVAFRNESQLENLLKSILLQDTIPLNFELVIVDNGDDDKTNRLVAEFNRKELPFDCIYLKNTSNNLGTARQKAVEKSRFDQVLFLDPDCRISRDWLSQIVQFMAENKDSAGGIHFGSLASIQKDSFFDVLFSFYSLSGLSVQVGFSPEMKIVNHIPAMNSLYDKRALLESGGFSGDFPLVGEDLFVSYLFRKKGIKMVYAPIAPVIHEPPPKLAGWIKKAFKYGYGQKLSFKKDSRSIRMMAFLPVLFFMVFILLLGFHTFLAILLLLTYIGFVFAEVSFTKSSRHLSFKTKWDLFIWILATHQAYVLGELFG